jgi:hypothetical protein
MIVLKYIFLQLEQEQLHFRGYFMVDFDPQKPNGDPISWNYFFDIIDDSNASVGKFSINAIGRRIKSIRDDNITIIYPKIANPNYRDSSNRDVKVILYEDLESVPLTNIYSLSVTASRTVSAILSSPVDIKPGDRIVLSSVRTSPVVTLPSGLLGTFTVTGVQSNSTIFTFSTEQTVSDGTYYLNFNRSTYLTTSSGRTTVDFSNGVEAFTTNSLISGQNLPSNTYVTGITTATNYTRLTLSNPTSAQVPVNSHFNFSVVNATLIEYSNFQAVNADALQIEAEFESLEIPYVSILKSQIENYLNNEDFQYKSDAFSTMKNLVYTHTNFNQGVSINSIPLYFLEPNKRIHLSDINTEIFGDHYLQSYSVPLSNEGTMQMSAIKIQQ